MNMCEAAKQSPYKRNACLTPTMCKGASSVANQVVGMLNVDAPCHGHVGPTLNDRLYVYCNSVLTPNIGSLTPTADAIN